MPRKLTPAQAGAAQIHTLLRYFEVTPIETAEIAFGLVERVMKDRRAKSAARRPGQQGQGEKPAPATKPAGNRHVAQTASNPRQAAPETPVVTPPARPPLPAGEPPTGPAASPQKSLSPAEKAEAKRKQKRESERRRQAKIREKKKAEQAGKAGQVGQQVAGQRGQADPVVEAVPESLPPQAGREHEEEPELPLELSLDLDAADEIIETKPVIW